MFYKYTTDISYITESGRKNNKQARTWVCPKRKKGEGFGTFLAFSGYRERVPERNSHTVTRNADSSPRAGWPGFWIQKSRLLASAAVPLSDRRLSLFVANSSLLTALGPCLFSSSSGLVWNLARKPFVWGFAPKQTKNPLIGAHLHSHSSCHVDMSLKTKKPSQRPAREYLWCCE